MNNLRYLRDGLYTFTLKLINMFLQYLADIEDHLNVTIAQVGSDIKVPLNEFDGKVTYGEKRMAMGE